MDKLRNKVNKTLHLGERCTDIDMAYITDNGKWLLLAQIVSGLQTFAVTIILANTLVPEVLAEYRLAIASLSILLIFSLPGMQTAIMESTPKGFLGNLLVGIKSKVHFGLTGSVVALVVGSYYFYNGNETLSWIFIILAFFIPLFDSSTIYTQYLHALKKFKKAAIYNIFTRIALLLALVVVAYLSPSNSLPIILTFLAVQTLINFTFTRIVIIETETEEQNTDKGLVPYAKHLSIMAALTILAIHMDQILVWHFVGARELAIFFLAMAIPQEFLRFAGLAPSLAFPKFATANRKYIQKTLMPKMFRYFLVVLVITFLYIITAPLLFKTFLPTYTDAVQYTQVLAIVMLQAPFLLIKTYFNSIKAVKILYFLSTFFPILRIILGIILVTYLGIWGIVFAIVTEMILRVLFSIVIFKIPKMHN